MVPASFPYRAIGCENAAQELQLRTERIKQLLETITRAAGQIGEDLDWALLHVRLEIYVAWLYSEFRWTAVIGDGFAEASTLAQQNRSDPESALRIAAALTGNAVAARELMKNRDLLQAYREVIKGDASFCRWPCSSRPRKSLKHGRPRVRSRVFRSVRRIPSDGPEEVGD